MEEPGEQVVAQPGTRLQGFVENIQLYLLADLGDAGEPWPERLVGALVGGGGEEVGPGGEGDHDVRIAPPAAGRSSIS